MYKYSQIQEILQTVQQEFYYYYYSYYKQSFDTGILSSELCSWYMYISVTIMM